MHQLFLRPFLGVFFSALLLGGCSMLPTKEAASISAAASSAAKAHAGHLAQLQRCQANGKIKISVDDKPNSAAFEWQQFTANYTINFFGPFGYGSSWLRRTSKGVTLESPDHPTQWASSPEQLLQQTLGWQAPIGELQYWVKGQAAPNALLDEYVTNDDGVAVQLRQQGWQIQLSRHQQHGDVWLPGKLVAVRNGVEVLIIVKEWVL